MSTLSRSVAIIVLGFALLLLRSVAGLGAFTPQLVLPIVIFLGVSPDVKLARGSIIAFVLGYASDNFCGLPMSLHTFLTVATFLIARGTGLRLFLRGPWFQVGLTFVASALFGAATTAMRSVFEVEAPFALEQRYEGAWTTLAMAVTSAAAAPFVFGAVQAIEESATGRKESARA